MRKILILLIVCLLIAQSVTCQVGYPKRIKIGNDSLVAFTNWQVKEFHKLIIRYENLRQDSIILSQALVNCNKLLNIKVESADNDAKIISNFRGEISLYKDKDQIYQKKVDQLDRKNKLHRYIVIGETSIIGLLLLFIVVQ